MSESSARMSTSLAITEKKPQIQRVGGCVGIFFQLFDWNRRFAKKKFFPKKLLPPGAKVSKKFNAEEKLPVTKHLLIADENRGGFPRNMKKKKGDSKNKVGVEPKKHEMQPPGLVARLMGLEALPVAVVEHDRSSKISSKDDCKGKGRNSGGRSHNLELSPEKVNVRPQKLQKTGLSEGRMVTRFGAEALQIKNVLSRSRKNHNHPKLASPVKSPKMGRTGSRLIDAAARILEPGIQATNRARCSLSYPSSMMQSKDDLVSEVEGGVDLQNQPGSVLNSAEILNASPACRSCGNVFELMDLRSVAEKQLREYDLPVSSFRGNFFRELEESRPRPAVYLENENDVVLLKTRYQPECSASQPEYNRRVQSESMENGTHPSQAHNQIPVNRIFTSQKAESPSIAPRQRSQRHGEMLFGDRVPPKTRMVNTRGRRMPSPANAIPEAKDFISINRNISQTRQRVPSKPDKSFETDRRFHTGKNDSLATQRYPVRKRRPLPVSRQADNATSVRSSVDRQRSNRSNVATGNGLQIRSTTVNQTRLNSRSASQRVNRDTIRTDVVSFTFSSPVKSSTRTASHDEPGVRRRDPILQESVLEENDPGIQSQNYVQMNEDALGAILEQKLKELTRQVETEAATGYMPSAKTSASILQELISALTAERPSSSEERDLEALRRESECDAEVLDSMSQVNSSSKNSSDRQSHGVDQFSPGCVLDASFSNESCISSSIDDNSVKSAFEDVDLSDSASTTNKGRRSDIAVVTDLVNHTSAMLQDAKCVHSKLTTAKRDYVQEIILNAELLFGNTGVDNSSRFGDFLLGPFLDELETLVIAAWKNNIIVGIEVRKEENPLRAFLIDCLIECLDVKYTSYIDSGIRALRRLPKTVNAEDLIKMFDEEIRKWISFAGKTTDDIIAKEMSLSLGKWTDFEIEAQETATQINESIVQTLVDEIIVDLCGSK